MANTFVQTKGIDAIASLVLNDCEVSRTGIIFVLDPTIRDLFISATVAFVHQVDGGVMKGMQESAPLRSPLAGPNSLCIEIYVVLSSVGSHGICC